MWPTLWLELHSYSLCCFSSTGSRVELDNVAFPLPSPHIKDQMQLLRRDRSCFKFQRFQLYLNDGGI